MLLPTTSLCPERKNNDQASGCFRRQRENVLKSLPQLRSPGGTEDTRRHV